MSTCVEDVFRRCINGRRGWRRVVYTYMSLCTAEQAQSRVLCLLRNGIEPSRRVRKEVLVGTVCFSPSTWLIL